jgi:hypothetical protein
MRRVPAPDFEHPVVWLEIGDQQLHLFHRDTPAPEFHHIGLDVDDFEAAYTVRARARALRSRCVVTQRARAQRRRVQMYLRDPAGNLVEVNWPDAGALDRSVVTTMKSIADERPQSDEAMRATLYPERRCPRSALAGPSTDSR